MQSPATGDIRNYKGRAFKADGSEPTEGLLLSSGSGYPHLHLRVTTRSGTQLEPGTTGSQADEPVVLQFCNSFWAENGIM
jgi:hypothetical protein